MKYPTRTLITFIQNKFIKEGQLIEGIEFLSETLYGNSRYQKT